MSFLRELFLSPPFQNPIRTPAQSFPFTAFLVFEKPPFGVVIDCFNQLARLVIMNALKPIILLFRIEIINGVLLAVCIYCRGLKHPLIVVQVFFVQRVVFVVLDQTVSQTIIGID